ncbi:MAG: TatD family hydrolase [Polyangia bacterium]
MFDSHCHLHDDRMREVRTAAIERAAAAGVRAVLLAGVDESGWRVEDAMRRQAQPLTIAVAYGLHPQVVPLVDEAELARQLEILAAAARGERLPDGTTLARPHALGEIGLDARTDETKRCLDLQTRVFREQLALARALDLPVVLHILRTHEAALRVLRTDGLPRRGGVVHSFSGSAELVRDYVKLGLFISLSGAVSYSNARRLHAAARAVPDELLLVETDAPDQTPPARRPGTNEPAFLVDVIAAVAELRAQTVAHVAAVTDDNTRRLLGLAQSGIAGCNYPHGTPD